MTRHFVEFSDFRDDLDGKSSVHIAPIGSHGFVVYRLRRLDRYYLAKARTQTVRVFKTLDAAYKLLADFGVQNIYLSTSPDSEVAA